MYCRNCGTNIGEGAKFCQHCGTPSVLAASPKMQLNCDLCGNTLRDKAKFCSKCGSPVAVPNVKRELQGVKVTPEDVERDAMESSFPQKHKTGNGHSHSIRYSDKSAPYSQTGYDNTANNVNTNSININKEKKRNTPMLLFAFVGFGLLLLVSAMGYFYLKSKKFIFQKPEQKAALSNTITLYKVVHDTVWKTDTLKFFIEEGILTPSVGFNNNKATKSGGVYPAIPKTAKVKNNLMGKIIGGINIQNNAQIHLSDPPKISYDGKELTYLYDASVQQSFNSDLMKGNLTIKYKSLNGKWVFEYFVPQGFN
jgi:hypothetical protein